MNRKTQETQQKQLSGIRFELHEGTFEPDTPAGKAFDVELNWAIIARMTVDMLESMSKV